MNVLDIVNAAVTVIEEVIVVGIVRIDGPEFEPKVAIFFRGWLKRIFGIAVLLTGAVFGIDMTGVTM